MISTLPVEVHRDSSIDIDLTLIRGAVACALRPGFVTAVVLSWVWTAESIMPFKCLGMLRTSI